MSINTANPLAKHFRQPAIYLKLPSQGRFWPEETLDLPMNNEIPVYPMTAKDEIILRTPDALMNGQGMVDVIQSCCPNILDAWKMPSIDVDAVLIAIRIASYGTQMDMDLNCPHCGHEHALAVDLSRVLDGVAAPDYSEKVDCGTIKIKLHPQQYFTVNNTNQIRYEEDRILRTLASEAIDEDTKVAEYAKHLGRIVDLNIDIVVNSTEYIELQDSTIVSDPAYIKEFYANCQSEIVHKVQTRLEKITKDSKFKNIDNSCPDCEKPYSVPLEFDYANFFVGRS